MLSQLAARLRSSGRPSDAGMSLTELVVGMTLLSIVGGLSMAFFVGTLQQTSRTTNQDLDAASARVALDQISDLLRVADTPTNQPGYSTGRFGTITSTSIVFYSNVAVNRTGTTARSAPAKVQVSVVNGALMEYLWWPLAPTPPADYTKNYATSPSSTTMLIKKVTNTDIFTYYATAASPSAAPAQTTSPDAVASVTIRLVLGALTGNSAEVLTSSVGITGALS